eukprot:IDg4377t1
MPRTVVCRAKSHAADTACALLHTRAHTRELRCAVPVRTARAFVCGTRVHSRDLSTRLRRASGPATLAFDGVRVRASLHLSPRWVNIACARALTDSTPEKYIRRSAGSALFTYARTILQTAVFDACILHLSAALPPSALSLS